MRHAHQTFIARAFAALIVCLVVSPVTAPFTTLQVGDFMHHRHTEPAQPGFQFALPDLNAGPAEGLLTVVGAGVAACGATRVARDPGLRCRQPGTRAVLWRVLRV